VAGVEVLFLTVGLGSTVHYPRIHPHAEGTGADSQSYSDQGKLAGGVF
jgi:hypothetical protein